MDKQRIIGGVTYDIVRTKCNCICHQPGHMVIHIMACCNNGWKEKLVRAK